MYPSQIHGKEERYIVRRIFHGEKLTLDNDCISWAS